MDDPKSDSLTTVSEPKYTERVKAKWRELDQWVTMLHGTRDEHVLASVKAILDDALPKDDAEWDIYNSHHNLFLSDCKAVFRLWRDNKRFKYYLLFSDAFHIVSGLGLENFIYLSLKDNTFEVKPKKDSAPPQPLTDDDIIDKRSRMGRLKMHELTAEGYKPPFHGLSAKMVRERARNPRPAKPAAQPVQSNQNNQNNQSNQSNQNNQSNQSNQSNQDTPNNTAKPVEKTDNIDKMIEAKLAAVVEARVDAILNKNRDIRSPPGESRPYQGNIGVDVERPGYRGNRGNRGSYRGRGDYKNDRGDYKNDRGDYKNDRGDYKNDRGDYKNDRGSYRGRGDRGRGDRNTRGENNDRKPAEIPRRKSWADQVEDDQAD
jgi:hypothetical protein